MRIKQLALAPLILSAVLFAAVPAFAQTCQRDAAATTSTDVIDRLQALESAGCLGGPACTSEICGATKGVLAADKPTRDDVAAALRRVLQDAKAVGDDSPAARRLLGRMGLTLAQYVETGRTAAAAWVLEDLVLFGDDPDEIDIQQWAKACTTAESCTATFRQAQRVIELSTLFRRMLIKAGQPGRNAFGAHLEALDRQWRAYLSSSRGQYPWELALNSALYRKTAQFDAPPTSQWIFAHPGAGYELTRNASDRQPSESLLLEALGIYRWSWGDDKMKQRLGGSATLAWRDAGEGRNKLGYGVLIYLPRSSTIGYVFRRQDGDDEHALVLSADLVKFIRGTSGIKERLLR